MDVQVPSAQRLCVRWTVGNLRPRGFEMLRLSIACAAQLFGPEARYLVCVNSLPAEQAQRRTGELPLEVEWRHVLLEERAPALRGYFDEAMLEGTGWKLVPVRIDAERYELAIDNDCILWDVPAGIRRWLESGSGGVLAQDVSRCLGSFDAVCPPGAYNSGIRGIAPDWDWERALESVLEEVRRNSSQPLQLLTELDEQGLQTAAIFRNETVHLVRTSEVSICSPFWPRSPELGSCGAHFVGMNAQHTAWSYYDQPANNWLDRHWKRHRPTLYETAGLPMPEDADVGEDAFESVESPT